MDNVRLLQTVNRKVVGRYTGYQPPPQKWILNTLRRSPVFERKSDSELKQHTHVHGYRYKVVSIDERKTIRILFRTKTGHETTVIIVYYYQHLIHYPFCFCWITYYSNVSRYTSRLVLWDKYSRRKVLEKLGQEAPDVPFYIHHDQFRRFALYTQIRRGHCT